MAKRKIQVIPLDSIIPIEVSGHFYTRIQQMLISMANEKSPEEFVKVMKNLETNKQSESIYEYNIHTISSLIFEIESQAKNLNLLKEEEIDIPEDDKPVQ